MPTNFIERVLLDSDTKMRETNDGYLVCNPRVARTGIQLYTGAEVGRPDLKEVRVYRPESEVFHVDAIASLAHKPVTDEHPDELVTSSNWRELAVGHLGGELLRDGDFVRVPLVLMDSAAITEVKDGKTELSVGYTAMLKWGDGVTDKGEKYDATQTEIRANHVAITHTARGGNKLRMGDNKRKPQQEKSMATRSIMIDGITVEMEERDVQVVERQIGKLETDLEAAQAELKTLRATSETALATAKTETANVATQVQTKDAEIATLKQQLTDSKLSPQQLDKMVADRVQTVQKAKSILGDAVLVDGKTEGDIRRQVVLSKLGDQAKDWNDDMVTASFNTLTATITTQDAHNGFNALSSVLQNTSGVDPRTKAYNEYEETLANRWKTAGARVAS
jgi:hypothetical protein